MSIPISKVYGGAGKFGFDPRAHLTETSSLVTPENALKLRQSWERYRDQSKAIRVEKTPGNLLKTRFLQAMFPDSYFIVVRRHPVPVSMASQRWKINTTSLHRLLEHWLHCHDLFEQDKKYLTHLYELTYESYIADPARYHEEIARFIGTSVPEGAMEKVDVTHNQKYLARWRNLLETSFFKVYYRHVARKYDREICQVRLLVDERIGYRRGGVEAQRRSFRCPWSRVLPWGKCQCFLAALRVTGQVVFEAGD